MKKKDLMSKLGILAGVIPLQAEKVLDSFLKIVEDEIPSKETYRGGKKC